MTLKSRKPMAKMSAKKKAERALAGDTNPMSTFTPSLPSVLVRQPRMATAKAAKRATDTGPSPEIRDLVLERDQYSCVMCGRGVGDRRGVDYSIHHRVLRSAGVDNSPSNLITLCGNGTQGDHAAVHAKPKWAREFGGWLLKGSDDPATFPVLVERGARWVLLLADGKMRTVAAPEIAVAA